MQRTFQSLLVRALSIPEGFLQYFYKIFSVMSSCVSSVRDLDRFSIHYSVELEGETEACLEIMKWGAGADELISFVRQSSISLSQPIQSGGFTGTRQGPLYMHTFRPANIWTSWM